MQTLCSSYAPGNTDLAWTRITPWRALLAAALDQHQAKVIGASVAAERISPSADLLVTWLADRLKVTSSGTSSTGPGITEVVLDTKRPDQDQPAATASWPRISSPGRPDRPVALKRRDVPELLAEELRRLDEDDVYAAMVRRSRKRRLTATERPVPLPGSRSTSTRRPSHGSCRRAGRRASPPPGPGARSRRSRSPAAPSLTTSIARWRGWRPASVVDWSGVDFWWGDERFVARDSSDRNAVQARAAFARPGRRRSGAGARDRDVRRLRSVADAAESYAREVRDHGAVDSRC